MATPTPQALPQPRQNVIARPRPRAVTAVLARSSRGALLSGDCAAGRKVAPVRVALPFQTVETVKWR